MSDISKYLHSFLILPNFIQSCLAYINSSRSSNNRHLTNCSRY